MATERVTRYVRLVIDASGAKSGGREVSRALRDIDRGVQRTSSHLASLKTYLAGAFAAVSVREIVRLADTWNLMAGRLRNVSDSAEAAIATQHRLLAVANATRSSLEMTAAIYTKVASVTEHLALTEETLFDITEAVNQSFRVGSLAASEAAASALQLAQGLGSGVLQGDELKSVLENNIPLSKALAKEFGVMVPELKKLGADGVLTVDRVISAILNGLDEFREQAANLPNTVGGALQVLENQFMAFIGQLDAATGASSVLSDVILTLAYNLDTLAVFFGVMATAAIPRVISGFRTLGAIIMAHPLVRLAVLVATGIAALYELSQATISYGDHTADVGSVVGVVFGDILSSMSDVFEFAQTLFESIIQGLASILHTSGVTFSDIANIAKTQINFVIAVGKSLVDFFVGYFQAIGAAGTALWEGLTKGARLYAEGALEALTGNFSGAIAKWSEIAGAFDFSGVEAALSGVGKSVAGNFGRDFLGELGAVVNEYAESVFSRAGVSGAPASGGGAGAGGAPTIPTIPGGGKKGGGKGGASDAEKLAEEFRKLEEALTPVLAAQREMAEVQALLNAAVAAGITSEATANELLARKGELLAAALDPLAAIQANLASEIELARLSNEERTIEAELRAIILDLQRQGVELSAAEIEGIRGQIVELQRLNGEMGRGKKGGETFADGLSNVLSDTEGAFGSLASAAEDGLGRQSAAYKAAFAVSKAAAIAGAIVSTASAVAKALDGPPPMNYVNAAISAAAGAAQIATITSTAIQGFQGGGHTGSGPLDRVAGVVHAREFVMDASATAAYRPTLEAMNAGTYSPANESRAPVNVTVNADGLGPVDVTTRETTDGLEVRIARRVKAEIARDIGEGGGQIDAALTRSGRRRAAG